MDKFVKDVLGKASGKEEIYSNISDELAQKAKDILSEYNNNPDNTTGAVIGVDLKKGEIRISRWGRE